MRRHVFLESGGTIKRGNVESAFHTKQNTNGLVRKIKYVKGQT